MPLDYGIRVSKNGEDVKTAADKFIQFSSKFSTLKILARGTTTISTNGSGNGSVTIPHGLNYPPAHYVFIKGTAQNTLVDASSYPNSWCPITQVGSSWIPNANFVTAYADDTNLVITATGAAASTTLTFRYFLFVDLSKAYSSTDGLTLTNDFGMKVSKPGVDVKTAEEYDLVYSSRYRSLQYYEVSYKTQAITLPSLYASISDPDVKAGTYVDFTHGLGYPPFFFMYVYNIPNTVGISGYNHYTPFKADYGNLATDQVGYVMVDGFCDDTRIRGSIIEQSKTNGDILDGNFYGPVLNAVSATLQCFPFTENLSLT